MWKFSNAILNNESIKWEKGKLEIFWDGWEQKVKVWGDIQWQSTCWAQKNSPSSMPFPPERQTDRQTETLRVKREGGVHTKTLMEYGKNSKKWL